MKYLKWFLPAAAFVCGAVLIASAVYNQSLWANDPGPSNALSRRILGTQATMVMALIVLLMSNFVSAVICGLKKDYKVSTVCLAAAAFVMIALVFTMAYDRASVFFQ